MERAICIRCNKQPPEPGLTNCSYCREYKSLYAAGRRDIRKLKGVCCRCGKVKITMPPFECLECRKHISAVDGKRAAARRETVNKDAV